MSLIDAKFIADVEKALKDIVEKGVTFHRQGAIQYARTLDTKGDSVDIDDYPSAMAVLQKYGNHSRECRFYLSMDELAWMQKAQVPTEEVEIQCNDKSHIRKVTVNKKIVSVQSLTYTELALAWVKGETTFRMYNSDGTRKKFNQFIDLWLAKCCISLRNWKTGNSSAMSNWVTALEVVMKPYLKYTTEGTVGTDPDTSNLIFTARGTKTGNKWTIGDDAGNPLVKIVTKGFLLDGWNKAAKAVKVDSSVDDYVRPTSDKMQRSKGVGSIRFADANVDVDQIMKLPSAQVQKMIRWNYKFVKGDENAETFKGHFEAKEKEVKAAHEAKLAEARKAKEGKK